MAGSEAEVLPVAVDSPCSAARRAASFCLRFCFFLLTMPSVEPFVWFAWVVVPFDAGLGGAVAAGFCVGGAIQGSLYGQKGRDGWVTKSQYALYVG